MLLGVEVERLEAGVVVEVEGERIALDAGATGWALAEAGYGDVAEVRTAEEDLMFSLPKELRQDAEGRRDGRALGGRNRS